MNDSGIRFLLNGAIEHADASPTLPLLDYLRDRRRLVGSKEGCHEGDCGACAVLLGAPEALDGEWRYRSVTSCLLPLAAVAGRHVITIEGLNRADGALTEVQRAIVDGYGSQCGFCTPGIVVSFTEMVLDAYAPPDRDAIKRALGGHLCRCTGYGGLLRAGDLLTEAMAELDLPADGAALARANLVPEWFAGLDERRAELEAGDAPDNRPDTADTLAFAGGTDLYSRGPTGHSKATTLDVLDGDARMRGIELTDITLSLGAMVTTRQIMDSAAVATVMPSIATDLLPVAAQTIRNRSTLGGNIVTGAHNADLATIMLGLAAELEIARGAATRRLPLAEFYRDDGALALDADERLIAVHVPRPAALQVNFERVTKRGNHDKAIVNSLLRVCERDGRLHDVRLADSGIGARPRRLRAAEAWLQGRPADAETLAGVLPLLQAEADPPDDYQGSATYKRLLLRQLVIGHFQRLFGARLSDARIAAAVRP